MKTNSKTKMMNASTPASMSHRGNRPLFYKVSFPDSAVRPGCGLLCFSSSSMLCQSLDHSASVSIDGYFIEERRHKSCPTSLMTEKRQMK